MLHTALIFVLSGLAAGTSIQPSPTPSSASPWQACAASMNGQLPAQTPSDFHFSGNVRRYYVAAEEVQWDYAPMGWDNWLGVPIDKSPRAKPYTKFNTTYLKALYRGYTDASFTQLTEQPPWQGTQGPTLRSEVGDLLEIMFNEGSDYVPNPRPHENATIPLSSAVPPLDGGIGPGECVVYKWLPDDAVAPNGNDQSRAFSYHSYVDLLSDSDAGLTGPQIVYARGRMNATMQNYKEFPLLFGTYNEPTSFLGNYSVWYPQVVNLASSGRFEAAPEFKTLNGYIFGNNPPFEMCQNDQAIWYAYGWGSDSHVFHMHGNAVVVDGVRSFAVSLNDGVSKTLLMTASDVGFWQAICHVNNHQQDGMLANYVVYGAGKGEMMGEDEQAS
ncbi:hypothetical protein M409DRAFT_67295 [Zasmidium cellare ATCC 36951]|uniref:Plastocyanin-like domain-containing protein n=1 Tax=Zasmidium cellare ATCC 36951 TaxID=1080233 RepID=A0A6A6CH16_ZASCE|nr:uncharacterized protein M409DRAFT_67295 [Zasmidium cellare ATCC 36951]KAF2165478.1 hypothetical protein M409DRAFT_67295 [Zasmidium cellare ATCC 36951]